MNAEEFRRHGKEMVDAIVQYRSSLRERPVTAAVRPGFMRQLLPRQPPQAGESFDAVLRDLESVVFAGVNHWQHPQFHAYYPMASSYPALLADMLSDAIGAVGFSWAASPAYTELEMAMMDWLVVAMALPPHFLFADGDGDGEGRRGGGVIHGSASEASLMAFFGARNEALIRVQQQQPELQPWEILGKMVAYTSDQAHSSVERAAKLAFVQIRLLPTDEKRALRGPELQRAIREDQEKGLVPILCMATMGTTSSCAFDNLEELGQVCSSSNVWLHVDAAYAGSCLLCPELRHLAKGAELAESFCFNAHKWMEVTFDCSVLWLKDSSKVVTIFNDNPEYLRHELNHMPEYRHWQIPLGFRFRSLKIWFVVRCFGISGLQERVRKDIRLAKMFESLLAEDERFEVVEEVVLGLVCFRLKSGNADSEQLYKRIRADNRIHLVASRFEKSDTFFLRFVICSQFSEEKDVRFAYDVIRELADAK